MAALLGADGPAIMVNVRGGLILRMNSLLDVGVPANELRLLAAVEWAPPEALADAE